jgi:hypothetical protein
MTDAQLFKELSALPDALKKEVADFIAFLKRPPKQEKIKTRPLGLMKGKVVMHKNFDDPIPGFEN